MKMKFQTQHKNIKKKIGKNRVGIDNYKDANTFIQETNFENCEVYIPSVCH